MTKPKFRTPDEMPIRDPRAPVSARVRTATKDALERAAKKSGRSIGDLIGNVLDDYVIWLEDHKNK